MIFFLNLNKGVEFNPIPIICPIRCYFPFNLAYWNIYKTVSTLKLLKGLFLSFVFLMLKQLLLLIDWFNCFNVELNIDEVKVLHKFNDLDNLIWLFFLNNLSVFIKYLLFIIFLSYTTWHSVYFIYSLLYLFF